MLELFSDIFSNRDHFLTRMDPRAKLVFSLLIVLLVILSGRAAFPLTVLAAGLAGMLALGVPKRLLLARLAGPMGMVTVLILLQSFLSGTTEIYSASWGAVKLSLKEEGLRHGLLMGSRVLGAVSAVMFLSLITPAHRVFHALLWFRVPRGWVEVAMLMYRYIFSLLDDVADVAAAQKVRLGYQGVKRSLSSMGVLAGAVMLRSLDQAARTHAAMVVRGYRGSIPFGPHPKMAARDFWLMIGASAAAALLAFFLEGRLG